MWLPVIEHPASDKHDGRPVPVVQVTCAVFTSDLEQGSTDCTAFAFFTATFQNEERNGLSVFRETRKPTLEDVPR